MSAQLKTTALFNASQQSKADRKTLFAAMVATFGTRVADILTTHADLRGAEGACESELADTIVALSVQCGKDRGRYLAVVDAAFGTIGVNAKSPEYREGTVRQTVKSQGYTLGSCKVILHRARHAAAWLADLTHKHTDDKGKILTLRKLAALHNPPKAKADSTATPVTDYRAYVESHMVDALRWIAGVLNKGNATATQAKSLNAVADQIAAIK